MDKDNFENLSVEDIEIIEILIATKKKRCKKWILIGICACIIGLLTLVYSKVIWDFIEDVSPRTKAEVFDKNGSKNVYSFFEIDFLEPFYSDKISHTIGSNYESAEHDYYLIGNSKTNEFAIACIHIPSIIEDFSANSDGYIVYGESQSLSLPELEFSNDKSDEEIINNDKSDEEIINNDIIINNSITIDGKTYTVPYTIQLPDIDVNIDSVYSSNEITGDYSKEAIKKLSEKFDIDESKINNWGNTFLYVCEPRTDTSVLSAFLSILYILLASCTLLGFIPILIAASKIDKYNELQKNIFFSKTY